VRYTLQIKKQADKTLQSLSVTDRHRITEKIKLLGENPDNPILDIKPLQGSPIIDYVSDNGALFLTGMMK
jgi:mRNA interferase RelE/StbE